MTGGERDRRRGPGRGTLVAVVGPSGAGKDTLIRGAVARRTDLVAARRVISRPGGDVGEDFESVTEVEFARRRAAGAFALDWQAHGMLYAIPAVVEAPLARGRHVLANLSRTVVDEARAQFRPILVVLVRVPEAVLAERLSARGREDAAAIRQRLGRADVPVIEGPDVVTVDNAGTREAGVAAFLAALPPQPVSS